ncbi:MAG: hypothetical protein ACFFC7_15455 [Candidatus Hermodarchaeota archaeon]
MFKLQKIRKTRKLLKDRRGSPLVEQLIIIAVGFLILLILLGFVTGVFDWIFEVGDDAISIFKDLLPVF